MQKDSYKINPHFPGYRIYADGRIQSIQKTYIHYNGRAHQEIDNPRYLCFVRARKHPIWGMLFCSIRNIYGKPETVFIHKLLAQTFLPKPTNKKKKKVWFKDHNKDNCTINNVYWVTQGELNFIQQFLGTRDMAAQAKIMRERRPKNFDGGRKKAAK